jgi:hypothetical protein
MTAPQIVLRLADSPGLVATARELFRAYAESIGMDLEYQGFSAELAGIACPYVPPNGALLTLYRRLEFVEIRRTTINIFRVPAFMRSSWPPDIPFRHTCQVRH